MSHQFPMPCPQKTQRLCSVLVSQREFSQPQFSQVEKGSLDRPQDKFAHIYFLFRYNALRKSEAKSGQWVVIAGAGGGLVGRPAAALRHILLTSADRDILHAKLEVVEWLSGLLELIMEARKIW